MKRYNPPGNVADLTDAQQDQWSEDLSTSFTSGVNATKSQAPDVPRAWFYNPITDDDPPPAAARDIRWIAFPKIVRAEAANDRAAWNRADNDRESQSEYCEWETLRDPAQANKVIRVTLTSETPDYYDFLAAKAPDTLLDLYRTHVSPQVQPADLVAGGRYNPRNRWNWPQSVGAHGIVMHMGQSNNALVAAIILAGVASWPRADDNGDITGEAELIGCARFGEAGRNSDPHIGAQINELVRDGNEVSFADPAGLYIDSVDTTDWETPDGSDPADWIRVVRPTVSHERGIKTGDFAVRVIVEAPPGSNAVLGDVRIGNRKVQFGGQIADKVLIRLSGIARTAPTKAPTLSCGGDILPVEALMTGFVEAVDAAPLVLPNRLALHVNMLSPE